jgi:hypothetical protein
MKTSNELMLYLKGLKRRTFFLVLFFCFISALFSRVSLESIKTSSPPKIDGVLDDPVWKKAKGYSEFISFYPDYGKLPKEKTIVYLAYDEDNLYFAFKCFESQPGKIIGTIRKRDTILSEDLVGLFIDSHNDTQNAYFLLVNSLGIQQDGIMDSSGASDWLPDFIWESGGVKNDEGYSVEVKIPFKTLRFSNTKVVKMRIGFLRKIIRYSEQYAFPEWKDKGSALGYLGFCQFEGIKYKRLLQVLPSITYLKRRERDAEGALDSFDERSLGLTAKIGVTSDLTLDMTLNPDFSHIEIDEGQVDVNLRVDPLFKEKRPFFLEGLEHFNFALGDDFHIGKIVHTRKIIEPLWGLKLSGKLGRYSVINSLFSVDESTKNIDSQGSKPGDEKGNSYYGIFRYKHLLKNDSYVGSIYTGKELKFHSGEEGETISGFNRVVGVDSLIRFSGFMTLDAFFLYSFNKFYNDDLETFDNTKGPAFGGRFKYEDRKTMVALKYHELSRHFALETGRLLRKGIRSFSPEVVRYIYPPSEFLKMVALIYSGRLSRDTEYNMNEYAHQFSVEFQLPLSTVLSFGYDLATEVFAGKLFDKDTFFTSGSSKPSKHLQLNFEYNSGGSPFYKSSSPFQGHLKTLFVSVTFLPNKNFSTQFNLTNHIFQGEEVSEGDYNISIYRNKTIFQVNKYLSLRGIVEYYTEDKQILADALVEFTYIPGTVIHLGYGSTFSKEYGINGRIFRWNQFMETRSSFFFKASYLFRF